MVGEGNLHKSHINHMTVTCMEGAHKLFFLSVQGVSVSLKISVGPFQITLLPPHLLCSNKLHTDH